MLVISVPYNWSPVTAKIFVNKAELFVPGHTDSQGNVFIPKRYGNPTIRNTKTGRFIPISKERFKELIEMGPITDVTFAMRGDKKIIYLCRDLANQHGLTAYFDCIWMDYNPALPAHSG